MAFSRALLPAEPPPRGALTSAMVGIGMAFAAPAPPDEPNIEDTLLYASIEAMDHHDLRVLAVLVTWIGVHAPYVNADRLTKVVAAQRSERVRALWVALARWQGKDRRFARLAKVYKGPRLDLLPTGTEFQVKRHGEDDRFVGSPLRGPANVLRDRAADVLPPRELACRHRAYRTRVMIGPTYRADMWAALDADPSLSAAALARRTYGSFATAWHARRDYGLLSPGGPSLDTQGIHGLRWDDVAEQPGFEEVWPELMPLLAGAQFLAAHNATFDRSVIESCCRAGRLQPPRLPYRCTVALARKAFGIYPTRLPDVCARLQIPLDHHDPLSDAEACARIVLAAGIAVRWASSESPRSSAVRSPRRR